MARRVTVDLTDEASTEVDRISKEHGLTIADIFRHGFTLIRIYLDTVDEKKELRVVDPKDRDAVQTRIVLPRK